MSRVQLALRVADLEGSIAFYSKLFGTEPAKIRDGYANFAIAEPPLKLVLIQGEPGVETRLDHLGVEVDSTEQVSAVADHLKQAGLATFEENDTSCCYALQDKVWVHGPGKEPWEVYVVKADADTLGKSATPGAEGDACRGTTASCTSEEQSVDPTRTVEQAKAAAGCTCGR
ncbi:ArsI/CadI family heavy metal resistance metalloenzyme [Streptantibioticus ferralitis]|uniref:ArsI/CadI family heavy metal resistance metalloenzyme n=1 Tax=Streptantibioticus ferralitis TaxID=236510 RepID=A0ABT5Z0F2_9ACTN|nr:ArsI/CadI family heavy metal resistance metalloenzyme [Streptantibioticus ferralitis]MDF2257299.1 ArsI/CadI family heavy metal resistance metalloenzyme [Streptantibioticus ferralitis]